MNLSDAAEKNRSTNTRENECECICDTCIVTSPACGMKPSECVAALEASIADDKVKARKEES